MREVESRHEGLHTYRWQWVVERTFSWLGGMRRNNCNYEKYLRTACHVATVACVAFMLRYFR